MSNMKKIMLVDDDADFIAMNKAVLENNGYKVVVAYSGKECIKKVKTEMPDLIVLDVMMDNKTDGFHVTYDLRNNEETKNIPILMVTSINKEVPYKFERDDTWLPVDEFVEKPLEPQKLLTEVKKRIKK